MLNVGKTHDTVRVVKDQIGTPTYTYDLARLLVDMNETEKYGYYHATNEGGYISWYDFTKEIYRQAGFIENKKHTERINDTNLFITNLLKFCTLLYKLCASHHPRQRD